MIDIHSHVLPGIDDGAQTDNDSIEMAKQAVSEGIHTIIATPHNRNGQYDNDKESILADVKRLNSLFIEENISLVVLPGQENRINGDMTRELERDELMPLNDTKYIFVEFPSGSVPRYAKQMIFDIQVLGYIPIIVHPERNRELIEDHDLMYEFIEKGALSQVTAASLVGKFGKRVKQFSRQLVEANLTHFIASDAHNITTRRFCMQEAYEEIKNSYGEEIEYLFKENAEFLIENESILKEQPLKIQKKKFLGIF